MMLRKCLYKDVPAYFHGFYQVAYPIEPSPIRGGTPGGQMAFPVAILELESGSIVRVTESDFVFQDRPEDEQQEEGALR